MKEACGVFGVYAPGRAVAQLTFDGLYALQHRGQESAGMAVSDGQTITVVKDMGLVTDGLRRADALGPLRATSPSATPATRPMAPRTGTTPSRPTAPVGRAGFALGHNGNLTDTDALTSRPGCCPAWPASDSDVVAELCSPMAFPEAAGDERPRRAGRR